MSSAQIVETSVTLNCKNQYIFKNITCYTCIEKNSVPWRLVFPVYLLISILLLATEIKILLVRTVNYNFLLKTIIKLRVSASKLLNLNFGLQCLNNGGIVNSMSKNEHGSTSFDNKFANVFRWTKDRRYE